MADPAIVGTPSTVEQSSTPNPWSHSHLLPSGGGTSRRALIGVHVQDSETVSSVTFGGQSASFVTSRINATAIIYLYELTEAKLALLTAGASHTLTVNFSGGIRGVSSFQLWSGADQGAIQNLTFQNSTGTTISNSITPSNAGSAVIDFVSNGGGVQGSADGGQTVAYNINASFGRQAVSSYKVSQPASSTTFGWSAFGDGSNKAQIICVLAPGITILTQSVSGVLTFTGNLTPVTILMQAVSGVLSFAGNLSPVLTITQLVSGVLSFAGNNIQTYRMTISGVLSFAGNVSVFTTRLVRRLKGVFKINLSDIDDS